MAADRADEENLKVTIFGAGEWGDMPIPLAMDYELVAETLGTAAVPLGTVTPLTLVSLAFIISELDKAMLGKPDDFLATWEAAITARGAQAATRAALRQTHGRRRWQRARPRSNVWLFASWRQRMA